jgi:integrase
LNWEGLVLGARPTSPGDYSVRVGSSGVGGRLTFGATKTHSTRRAPLPRSLAAQLGRHLEHVPTDPDALVFTSPEGAPLRHSAFRQRSRLPALKRAGVPPVGLHVLRHSAAAAMISSGASPKEVQSVLGHAEAGFTLSVYAHIFPEDLDHVADRLDALRDARTGRGRDNGSGDWFDSTAAPPNLAVDLRLRSVGRAGLEPATDGL